MGQSCYWLAVSISIAACPVFAQTACPWAGGEYKFSERGIYGDFAVNSDCTEMVWERLTEPETTQLVKTNKGWTGDLSKVKAVLLEDGKHVEVTAHGGVTRRARAERLQ